MQKSLSTPVITATQAGIVAEGGPRMRQIAEVFHVQRVAGRGTIDGDCGDVGAARVVDAHGRPAISVIVVIVTEIVRLSVTFGPDLARAGNLRLNDSTDEFVTISLRQIVVAHMLSTAVETDQPSV